ncbi:MAG: hypothetical protein QGG40_05400, partial [Myxococcota bacterium]|nr:hypothetical protein [Myxococcota bacterium]
MALVPLVACGGSDAERFTSALSGDLPLDRAMDQCEVIDQQDLADECRVTVSRRRPDDATCGRIETERWRGECWFQLAESLVASGERWTALEACGRAGTFYGECLYHLWSTELAQAAEGAGRAVLALPAGREVVEFWSGIETLGNSAEEQLWGDWWFFALNANRPADLADCAGLPTESDRSGCEKGTRDFVLRSLLGTLMDPSTPADLVDRTCRSGKVPDGWTEGLFVSEPSLDAQVELAAELACEVAEGRAVRRWNPVFTTRRLRVGDGAPVVAP